MDSYGMSQPDESMDTQSGCAEMEGGEDGGEGIESLTFAGEQVPFDEQ